MSNAQILIVGAGPAGLTLALTLAKNGVPVRIIDKATQPHNEQRGIGLQPRTLEVFHFLETMPDFQAAGRKLQAMRLYKLPGGTEPQATFHIIQPADPTPSRPFNNPMQIGQCHTERILRSHLKKYGHSVEQSTELRATQQFDDHVEVTIVKHEEDKETIETASYRWIVGTDGGKSVVRKLAGFTFEGNALEERGILGEVQLQGLDTTYWHQWTRPGIETTCGIIVHARATETDGLFWFIIAGNVDYDHLLADHEALKQALLDTIERKDVTLGDIAYVSDYRPSVRMVNKFKEGRAFLAGDAAHVHTPRGGQGLNTSAQDAFNLGWKLALVQKGLAEPSFLLSYNEERLPVVQRMVQETKNMTQDLTRAHGVQSIKSAWQRGDHLKQLGINYRWSPIVVDERFKADVNVEEAVERALDAYGTDGDDALRAGDRAPDANGLVNVADRKPTSLFSIFGSTYHTVLLFCDSAARVEPVLAALKTYPNSTVRSAVIYPGAVSSTPTVQGAENTVKDQDGHAYGGYGVPVGQVLAVIVRPDGIVGGIVTGKEGVKKYFSWVFSLSARFHG